MSVGRVILEQLGGNKFLAMTGAKNLTGSDNGLSMRLAGKTEKGRIRGVRVTLNGDDTYSLESYDWYGTQPLVVKHKTDHFYVDQLRQVFESSTGLYTRLF